MDSVGNSHNTYEEDYNGKAKRRNWLPIQINIYNYIRININIDRLRY